MAPAGNKSLRLLQASHIKYDTYLPTAPLSVMTRGHGLDYRLAISAIPGLGAGNHIFTCRYFSLLTYNFVMYIAIMHLYTVFCFSLVVLNGTPLAVSSIRVRGDDIDDLRILKKHVPTKKVSVVIALLSCRKLVLNCN